MGYAPNPALIAQNFYGSGQDGAAVFDGANVFPFATLVAGAYTLTRNIHIGDGSSVSVGVILNGGGFQIRCNGRLTNNGVIQANGKDAVGAVAGSTSSLGTLGIGLAGGNGRANNTGLPGNGVPTSNALQDASAAGGAGGAGGVNAGGAGGTYSGVALNGGANHLTPMGTGFLFNSSSGGNQATIAIIGGGAGGGGGGSDNAGVTGGGGGGGGGVLLLQVLHLINNGVIQAAGGRGGDASGAGGNGGGGGGGAGGIILQISRVRFGAGTIVAPGGAGGNPIAAGVAGAPGNAGHVNAFYA